MWRWFPQYIQSDHFQWLHSEVTKIYPDNPHISLSLTRPRWCVIKSSYLYIFVGYGCLVFHHVTTSVPTCKEKMGVFQFVAKWNRGLLRGAACRVEWNHRFPKTPWRSWKDVGFCKQYHGNTMVDVSVWYGLCNGKPAVFIKIVTFLCARKKQTSKSHPPFITH